MKETEKLKLKKPDPEDFYNIQDFNDNMDALDADQARQDKAIQEHAGNATIHVTQAEKDGWNGKVPPTRKVNGKALSEDISLAAADVGALGSGSTAEAAKKLLTPRSIRANLASSAAANFDGTANITPGVAGILPVANGGTGSSVEKYLPLAGGTIAGNLTLKNSTAFGCKLNFGDGDYVHISEPTDDNMEIKAKNVTFSTTNPIHDVPTPSAGTDAANKDYVDQANEIMEFTIGTEPYGEVRWIGQILGVDGSRRAETLNNNYFTNGRHTPLMIMIEGGTLTDESFEKLQQYINDIKGEAGQHAFLLLETEASDGRTDFDQQEKPKITVKDLASVLQKDELFQGYLDNNRRKVQSAFQLPDLYVAYTTDFNRATAQTAQEVTEEQVFQPERRSLAWAINNRLLNGYQFQHVEAYFLEPDITNPDDLYKLLTVANNAGGVTPNFAKRIIYEAFGEQAEDYPEEWGDTPLSYSKSQGGGAAQGFDIGQLTMGLQQQIEKAASSHDDAVVAVMKEVKRLLMKMDKGG